MKSIWQRGLADGAECDGTDMAEAASVRISPNHSAPGSSAEGPPGGVMGNISSPVFSCLSMVWRFWDSLSPMTRDLETVDLAPGS